MLDLLQLIAAIIGIGYIIIVYGFKFLRRIFSKREFNKEIESLIKKISKEKYIQKIEEIENRQYELPSHRTELPSHRISKSILFPFYQNFKKSYLIKNKKIKGTLYLHFNNFFISSSEDIKNLAFLSKNLSHRDLDFYLENKKLYNEYLYINDEGGSYTEVDFCLNKDLKNINKIKKDTLDQIHLYLVKKINDPDPYYK